MNPKQFILSLLLSSLTVLVVGCGDDTDTSEPNEVTTNEVNSVNDINETETGDNSPETNGQNNENESEQGESGNNVGNYVYQAETELINDQEETVGIVRFFEEEDFVRVESDFENLQAGFHGFHIHEEAACEPIEGDSFTEAGGHYNPSGADHPDHAGDLPSLLAKEDGTAHLIFETDRFTVDELIEEEVSVIIHEEADNFANIPEHYESTNSDNGSHIDEDTLNTGDAGDRFACGEVKEVN